MRRPLPLLLAAILALAASCLVRPSQAAPQGPARALVAPFQPAPGTAYDGMGPAIQNVIENMLALSPDLEETYLLRHMREPFPSAGDLQAYMLGLRPHEYPIPALAREGARHIITGLILPGGDAEVRCLDLATGQSGSAVLPIDAAAGLVGFKRGLLDLLASRAGLSYPPAQAAKALRPDKTSRQALRAFGLSYGAYMIDSYLRGQGQVSLPLAETAAREAPESYLARNMLGWQLFAFGDLTRAEKEFRHTLKLDPDGVDALDGMMQCSIRYGGIEAATPWAYRKAKARGSDIGQPLAELHLKAGGQALDAGNSRSAAAHYKTAAALDPWSERAAAQRAMALEAAGRHDKAYAVMDALLERVSLPSMKARILNFKARLARWIAASHGKAGRTAEEKKSLERGVEFLKLSPVPDMHEYLLLLLRLARIAIEQDEAASAVSILKMIRPEKRTDHLLVDTVLAYALVKANRMDDAAAQARRCLSELAERMRTREPVSSRVFEYLGRTFELLGEAGLANSVERSGAERMGTRAEGEAAGG
ncbi:MAG: tetratricopeptide repeat protein [Thermodesulfobacteriota bacterium]